MFGRSGLQVSLAGMGCNTLGWWVGEAQGKKAGAIILKKNTGATSPKPNSEPSIVEKLANRDFIHFLMLMALIDQVKVFIVVAAIGASIFTIYMIYIRLTQESK